MSVYSSKIKTIYDWMFWAFLLCPCLRLICLTSTCDSLCGNAAFLGWKKIMLWATMSGWAGWALFKDSNHWNRWGLTSGLCLPSHTLSSKILLAQNKVCHFLILMATYWLIIAPVMMCFIWKPIVSAIFDSFLKNNFSSMYLCVSTSMYTHT